MDLHAELKRLADRLAQAQDGERFSFLEENDLAAEYWEREVNARRRTLTDFVVAHVDALIASSKPEPVKAEAVPPAEPKAIDPILVPGLKVVKA